MQTTVVAEVDQTTRTSLLSLTFPNPKSSVGAAAGFVLLCCRDTSQYPLRPLPSKTPDLHPVLGNGLMKVCLFGMEEGGMENDDCYLGHRTNRIRLHILDPMGGDRFRGSQNKGVWNYPTHEIP